MSAKDVMNTTFLLVIMIIGGVIAYFVAVRKKAKRLVQVVRFAENLMGEILPKCPHRRKITLETLTK